MEKLEPELSKDDIALICEFRAMPFIPIYTKAKDKNITPVSILCEELLKKYKVGERTPQEVILESWKSVIYGEFYKYCYPLSVKATTLYIKTENPAIRQHLSFDKNEILKNIQALDLCESIKEIRFI